MRKRESHVDTSSVLQVSKESYTQNWRAEVTISYSLYQGSEYYRRVIKRGDPFAREKHMNRTNRILPVYTGDVSGACSALYELGGMVVIHDPSGCNSTYNTHDETRWYDQDSLIFISGLVERDAILGNDNKLIDDVVDAALELHPRFIALCNSPIPFITGTDFAAICKIIERRTGIPCFYVRTNGMHDYTVGAGRALAEVAKRFVKCDDVAPTPHTLNILGVTPLDFFQKDAVAGLREFAHDAGFDVVSCWAMGSDLDELNRSAKASVNLVASSVGLSAAKVLQERFGTPFVVGTPVGGFMNELAAALRYSEETRTNSWPCRDARASSDDGSYCVVGEPVAAGSYASALERESGVPVRVVCPLEATQELCAPGDMWVDGEEEVERALARASFVLADALYAPVCPQLARLEPLPHLAFSGRNCYGQLTHEQEDIHA